jgi:hypothetical protein
VLASFFGSSSPSRRVVAEAVPVRVNVPTSGRLFPLARVGLSVVDELSPGVDAIDCKPAKLGDASLTEWNPEGVSVWTGVLETPRALTDPGVLIELGVPTPDCAISSSNWTPGIGPGRGLRARTCHQVRGRRAVFYPNKSGQNCLDPGVRRSIAVIAVWVSMFFAVQYLRWMAA